MKKQLLEQRLRTAVEHAAPDRLDTILSSCDEPKKTADAPPHTGEREKGIIYMSDLKTKKRKKGHGLAALAAMAAVFVFCIGCFRLFPGDAASRVDSVITLDVNPSISLSVDAGERVLAVEALNEDARAVLGTMDLKGSSLEVAVNAIIGSMLREGYLGDAQNAILISVENEDAARGQALQEKISQVISSAIQADSLDAAILSQNVSADDAALEELARQYGISLGKAALIQEVVAQASTLSFEDLAPMTINEIALIAASKNVSSESVTQSGAASDKAYISQAEALELACADAGIAVEDAEKMEVEFDSDHGLMVYEVEFATSTSKYEYEINAATGAVVSRETKDRKKPGGSTEGENAGGSTEGEKTGGSGASDGSSLWIGEDAAKNAALAHAGVSESSAVYVKCYLEYEDGKPAYYCVEFKADRTRYEYEIDLYSGAVLEIDVESHGGPGSDSADGSAGFPENTAEDKNASYIGKSAALAAALEHAGVAESDVTKTHIKLEREDGAMIYEVEFEVNRSEYEYEIDALSGAVLKAENH